MEIIEIKKVTIPYKKINVKQGIFRTPKLNLETKIDYDPVYPGFSGLALEVTESYKWSHKVFLDKNPLFRFRSTKRYKVKISQTKKNLTITVYDESESEN